jgi:hypothetical protein
MSAIRNDSYLKVGDRCRVVKNCHYCGGPACGTWWEDSAIADPNGEFIVTRLYTESDIYVTDSLTGSPRTFGYVRTARVSSN